ncbi:MAG: glycosyltransferase, partial [Pseudomonadota bacterium]
MNILHIGKYFAPFRGGVETYLYDVMRAQAAMGDRCLALVHNHDRSARQVTEQFDPAGASWTVWRSATWGKAFFTPLSPAFRNDLMDAIETFKPDVIHAPLPNPAVGWLLSRASVEGPPLVVHWHSDVG